MSDIGEKRLREIAESIESRLRSTNVGRDWSEIILVMLREELSGLLDAAEDIVDLLPSAETIESLRADTGLGFRKYQSQFATDKDIMKWREELSKWK